MPINRTSIFKAGMNFFCIIALPKEVKRYQGVLARLSLFSQPLFCVLPSAIKVPWEGERTAA